MFMEPAAYAACPLEAALTLLKHGSSALSDPTTVVFPRSWRRMVIMQKEIPRIGLVYIVRGELPVAFWARGHGHTGYRRRLEAFSLHKYTMKVRRKKKTHIPADSMKIRTTDCG